MIKLPNNYGGIFRDIAPLLVEARDKARVYYGTESYHSKLNVMIHRAFNRYCSGVGLTSEQKTKLYYMLRGEWNKCRAMYSITFNNLFLYLPNEFNVRGVWVGY